MASSLELTTAAVVGATNGGFRPIYKTKVFSSTIDPSDHDILAANVGKQQIADGEEVRRGNNVYIHVRHFTKHPTAQALSLEAIVWFEDGTCRGPFRLNERVSQERDINKPLVRHEILGETDIQLPLSKKVAFLQLRNKVGFLATMLGLEEEIFVHDAFLKPNKHESPAQDVLAYFRFTGFLLGKTNIILPNVLYAAQRKRLTVADVSKHAMNQKIRLQDRLLPVLEWASKYRADAFAYMLRTIADAAGLGFGRSLPRFIVDTITLRNTPFVANALLSLRLQINRYTDKTPGFAELPPGDFTFSARKFDDFVTSGFVPIPYAENFLRVGKGRGKTMAEIDFTEFLRANQNRSSDREVEETRRIVLHSDDDEEFGRQLTDGIFCTQIHVVPENERLRPKWLRDLIRESKRESSDSKLFYMDYGCLVGIPRNEGVPPNKEEQAGYFNPARCILEYRRSDTSNSNGKLYPIAISLFYCRAYYPDLQDIEPEQSQQVETEEQKLERRLLEGVWRTHLPGDKTWAVAKLFCKNAAAQHHQIVSHALYTHLAVEPFVVALERIVPLDHILYRILKTHFRYTLDINFKARTTLVNKGGVFDQFISTGGIHVGHLKFMARAFDEWTIDKMIFPRELASRGFVKDPRSVDCELPNYMYAQDAMTLWEAMLSFVRGIINDTYITEDEFEQDDVLRNYFLEVQVNGFPNAPSFCPKTREELVQILTGIIFTASVQHAAVNFLQFAHYAYVRNAPLSLSKPAPFPNSKDCNVEDYLPVSIQASRQISVAWTLSRFVPDDERFIYDHEADVETTMEQGNYSHDIVKRHHHFFNLSLYNDNRYRQHCITFQRAMRQLEQYILTRSPTPYGARYLWLLPSRIPTSIAT